MRLIHFATALLLSASCLCSAEEKTLAIIKPDAVKKHHIGEVIAAYEGNGLKVVAMRMEKLSQERAGAFYAAHKGRPFYDGLVQFMSSGPIVALVLEGNDAIAKNRALMGATDPAEAAPGTLRQRFASSKGENAVHGSDSKEAADQEIAFFFKPNEIFTE